ncbi:hypothetical protein WA026_008925 [Henosepilachna vigintioctopunctata]|uniref:Uncharacterized protein n=1 Tax=Henosepilachna vigintioctopunctata TaxID=420089 RepID=A0AAW1V943_9CUCU
MKVTWTVLYRRKHKKGQEEETSKNVPVEPKFQRAIVGASLNDIIAKSKQRPEVRKANRDRAIRAAKSKRKLIKLQRRPQHLQKLKQHPNKKLPRM